MGDKIKIVFIIYNYFKTLPKCRLEKEPKPLEKW